MFRRYTNMAYYNSLLHTLEVAGDFYDETLDAYLTHIEARKELRAIQRELFIAETAMSAKEAARKARIKAERIANAIPIRMRSPIVLKTKN